jgi:hypothetical protein
MGVIIVFKSNNRMKMNRESCNEPALTLSSVKGDGSAQRGLTRGALYRRGCVYWNSKLKRKGKEVKECRVQSIYTGAR